MPGNCANETTLNTKLSSRAKPGAPLAYNSYRKTPENYAKYKNVFPGKAGSSASFVIK